MILLKRQKNNKGYTHHNDTTHLSGGFTLIETMTAVFIMAVAVNVLLGLIASSLYLGRYSKNDMTANYLAQEAVDLIRYARDTYAFQNPTNNPNPWLRFLQVYQYPGSCFSAKGCQIEMPLGTANSTVRNCDSNSNTTTPPSWATKSECDALYYDDTASNGDFYTYAMDSTDPSNRLGVPTNFVRQVKLVINPLNADELFVTVTVEWKNGNLVRSLTLNTSLLNWQK